MNNPLPPPPAQESTGFRDNVRIKQLIDASAAVISLIDPERWSVVYQNKTGEEKLGSIVGQACYQSIPKLPDVCSFCRAREAIETGKSTSSEVPRPDGTWLLVQWSPLVTHDGRHLAVETITDITDIKKREEEYRQLKERFEHLSKVDFLTGLWNRRGWLEQAERIYRRALHDRVPLGILIIDVDHFKAVNDRYGHEMGDTVLRAVSQMLRKQCRPSDAVGRWGGEEFILMLYPPVRSIREAAERIRSGVADLEIPLTGDGGRVKITISVGGVLELPRGGDTRELEEWIKRADGLLYRAKEEGRNRVCL